MPPYMLGDYALPASDWRWYYCDNAFSLQGLQRFADALAEFDAEAGRKYRDEAEAFRRDIRRAVDREAALSPVRIGRDGVYRSFVPIAAYTRGLMLALEYPSVGRPQGDVILGALPLAEPFAALDANDARMVGTLDVMEEVGTSAGAVRELEEARKNKGLSTADAWFWNSYGASLPKASHNANIYLLQDDVPNFLRFWMNSYAIMVGADGKMWEWGDWGHYAAKCEHPDNGTAGWFLENFRNLLVMEEGPSLWIARGTPRPWLEAGKRISVKNAPTYFGTVAYEIVSNVDNGKITATIEIPSRNLPRRRLVLSEEVRGDKMTPSAVIVEGLVTPDGQLELLGKLDIPPGPVQVTVIAMPELPQDDPFWQRMRAIWSGQRARGHAPPSAAEVAANQDVVRDEWEERMRRIEQIQAEADVARAARGLGT
jgi:hypothetical protein